MEGLVANAQVEDLRDLAGDLLRKGEQCALAGLLWQAQTLLVQVWTLTKGRDAELANAAAWEVAWLLMRAGAYQEAAKWFERIAAPPVGSRLWPATTEALVQLCLSLARTPPDLTVAQPWSPGEQPSAAEEPLSSPLPVLEARNLGCFRIVRAQTVLPACRARKPIAIFRYLLTKRDRTAHKDELMDLFWPDTDPKEAGHSLHVAISTLRRYLDPPADRPEASYLTFEAGRYLVNPDARVEDDCHTFRQRSSAADDWWRAGDLPQAQQAYLEAIACYHGDFYVDNVDLAWAIAERERLLSRYLSMLDRVGQVFMGQGRFEPVVECYQRLLERDGYREDAHRQLMLCYRQLGRRGAALQQYERCATILANDLGLEPMQGVQALYRDIVAGKG